MNDKILRVREVAERLQVHEKTAQRWAREGVCGLKEVKIGKLVYIDVSNFEAKAKEVEVK